MICAKTKKMLMLSKLLDLMVGIELYLIKNQTVGRLLTLALILDQLTFQLQSVIATQEIKSHNI